MTNKQILEKAIQKAIDGGWKYKEFMFDYKYPNFKKTWTGNIIIAKSKDSTAVNINYIELFFNHDFAKALWGEELVQNRDYSKTITDDTDWIVTSWQYHLMQMVISEDPIKYLGENI